jgi:MobA/MobL family
MHSYLERDDVVYKEVLVPSEFAGNAEIAWTQDRAALWNAVESTNRRNAQLGREVMVVLPEELNAKRRTQLVRGFAQELADKYCKGYHEVLSVGDRASRFVSRIKYPLAGDRLPREVRRP